MVAIVKFEREHIFDAVKLMYTSVANQPEREFHFPTGRKACEYVGYPAEQLDRIIPAALESFAGVGYPFCGNVIKEGDTVLDIGAGAGTDVLLAALLTGPQGRVYGLDMTRAMHEKLHNNKNAMQLGNVVPLMGNAEKIPLEDNSVDVVTSNGVLNLVPDKDKAFSEIHRVLKPRGQIQISDIVIHKHFDQLDESKANPQLWAECIVGAMHEDDYLAAIRAAGFTGVEVLDRVDYFAASGNASTRETAEYFATESITIGGKRQ
ncbi:MAG: methyltransferase domain-containing protein [Granulosicoccaceae bacterium]|jgi:SAM-dependent methyltransferase